MTKDAAYWEARAALYSHQANRWKRRCVANAHVLEAHGIAAPRVPFEPEPVDVDELTDLRASQVEYAAAFREALEAAQEWERMYRDLHNRVSALLERDENQEETPE